MGRGYFWEMLWGVFQGIQKKQLLRGLQKVRQYIIIPSLGLGYSMDSSINNILLMNRPIALVCYICGREFGTKSLGIHLKSCQQKWANEQNLKAPRDRRPCPQPPPGLAVLLEKKEITKEDILKMNNNAFDTYMEEALVKCEYCGRKFNQTSLIPHQKACMKDPMIKKPYVSAQQKKEEKGMGSNISENKAGSNISQKSQEVKVPSKGYDLSGIEGGGEEPAQDLEECGKCGRKFACDRLDKHQKVCKGATVKVTEKKPVTQPPKPAAKKDQKDPKWKAQHQDFQNAMKYMRQMKKVEQKGGKISDLPPPPKGNYDHYVECKYCGRKYAADVAERHIPKCQNIVNKPGGIKPSQIQQKYIGSSGVNKSVKPAPVMTSAIKSPTISTVKGVSAQKPLKSPLGTANSQYGKMFKK